MKRKIYVVAAIVVLSVVGYVAHSYIQEYLNTPLYITAIQSPGCNQDYCQEMIVAHYPMGRTEVTGSIVRHGSDLGREIVRPTLEAAIGQFTGKMLETIRLRKERHGYPNCCDPDLYEPRYATSPATELGIASSHDEPYATSETSVQMSVDLSPY